MICKDTETKIYFFKERGERQAIGDIEEGGENRGGGGDEREEEIEKRGR